MISDPSFFHRDCLELAPALLGKYLCRVQPDGSVRRLRIIETEAYRGEEDSACHAHKGRTRRTEVMYGESGTLYVYLCYGIHWLLNIVSGEVDEPQAVLIRACMDARGPGRLTKALGITGEYNGRSLLDCGDLWLEDSESAVVYTTAPRVGIGYASAEDQALPWRFILKE